MIICSPVLEDKGLNSPVHNHFGSAPFFLIYDSKLGTHKVLTNAHAEHEHGKCGSFAMLKENGVEVVICRGMGKGALRNLQADGMKVFLAQEQFEMSKAEELIVAGKFKEMTTDAACQGHTHGDACH